MQGCEYLSPDVLSSWWSELDTLVRNEIEHHAGGVQAYLSERNPAVAARRPRDVSPRREQARPGAPLRIPGNLYSQALGPGSRAARALGQGFAGIRRGEKPAGAPFAPGADPARDRAQPAHQGDGRVGRDLSSPGLGPSRGVSVLARHPGLRGERPGRPGAGLVEIESPASPRGQRHDRWPQGDHARVSTPCSISPST